MKELKIIKCNDPSMWYYNKIGETLPIIQEFENEYLSREEAGFTNIVKKSDCVLISDFDKLVSNEKSNWLEKAKYREENEHWLDLSNLITIRILSRMREDDTTKEELELITGLDINKIVKGSENLTLKDISILEKALNIDLIK